MSVVLLITLLYSCQKSTDNSLTIEPENLVSDFDPNFPEAFVTVFDELKDKDSKRFLEFDPLAAIEDADEEYPEDLMQEYLSNPQYATLAADDNLLDLINNSTVSPESKTALTNLLNYISDVQIQELLDLALAASDDAEAISQVSNQLTNWINQWYTVELVNLSPEDAELLTLAVNNAISVIPQTVSSIYYDDGSSVRCCKWAKKVFRKVVSVVVAVVTGAVIGGAIGGSVGGPPGIIVGAIIGAVITGAAAVFYTEHNNVCFGLGCPECCNRSENECAALRSGEDCDDPASTAFVPWQDIDCNGVIYNFATFEQFCKHFK